MAKTTKTQPETGLRILLTCPHGRPGDVLPPNVVTGLTQSMIRRWIAQGVVERVEITDQGSRRRGSRSAPAIDVQIIEDITSQAEPQESTPGDEPVEKPEES